MIQKLDRLKQLGQMHKGPSLAAPMLAITTRSNELNEKNPQPNSALVSNCWAELITTQDNQLKHDGSKSSDMD
jgi:hypothetical protein